MTTEKYPETIYLLDQPECVCWCDDPDPSGLGDDAPEPVAYVRKDSPSLTVTDNSAVIARLQAERDALAESLRACSKALRDEVESRRGSELDRRVDRDLAEADDADDLLASLENEPEQGGRE